MESLVLLIKSKLGVLHLTGQMTGKPVKHGNLLVNRWSGKSLQFSALLTTGVWIISFRFHFIL